MAVLLKTWPCLHTSVPHCPAVSPSVHLTLLQQQLLFTLVVYFLRLLFTTHPCQSPHASISYILWLECWNSFRVQVKHSRIGGMLSFTQHNNLDPTLTLKNKQGTLLYSYKTHYTCWRELIILSYLTWIYNTKCKWTSRSQIYCRVLV